MALIVAVFSFYFIFFQFRSEQWSPKGAGLESNLKTVKQILTTSSQSGYSKDNNIFKFFSLYVNLKLIGQMMAITEELGSSSEEEDDPTKHHPQRKVKQSP